VPEVAEAPVLSTRCTVADPVLPEEMDTAGGPAGDDEVATEPLEDDVSEDLPTALATDDVGLVPLSLLEAEAAAEAVADAANAPMLTRRIWHPPLSAGHRPDTQAVGGDRPLEPQSQASN
jgi:hypothetical protein